MGFAGLEPPALLRLQVQRLQQPKRTADTRFCDVRVEVEVTDPSMRGASVCNVQCGIRAAYVQH
eukprot:7765138-Alexandrium_andersonii.AAC.1